MEFLIINIILLALVLLDATGDGLRVRDFKILHHVAEGVQVAVWFLIWALFGFHWLFVVMYVFARFVFFNVFYNMVTGNKFYYVGSSSMIDMFEGWVAKSQGPIFTFVLPRVIILVWWIAWLVSEANGIYI